MPNFVQIGSPDVVRFIIGRQTPSQFHIRGYDLYSGSYSNEGKTIFRPFGMGTLKSNLYKVINPNCKQNEEKEALLI